VTHHHPSSPGPYVALTDEARKKVIGFKPAGSDGDEQAMWIEITGQAGGEYTYDLSLKPLSAAGLYDAIEHHPGLAVVIPAADFDRLRGATVDWSSDLMAGGLRVTNPNKPSLSASPAVGVRPPADLSGDVQQRVMQVLEQHINPSIAAHGGRADLVAVEDGTAYVRMSGGCQGCGMASVTLSQGIEVALRDGVPEVARVVDVTDHAAGTNPYFEPAKK
jgi:Fe/S biogenesis protein NfuA